MTSFPFSKYNKPIKDYAAQSRREGYLMIKINNNLCCGCGHCSWIRFGLPLIKTIDGIEYHEDPRPEDTNFVENLIMECWSSAISWDK